MDSRKGGSRRCLLILTGYLMPFASVSWTSFPAERALMRPLWEEHSELVAEKVKGWVEEIVEEHGKESLI